jgi:DNA-binding NarL/FixJ family response regulator
MTDPIRVALVDDQELFRAGIAVVLDAQPDMVVVGEAGNGREALRLIADTAPDVVLLDLRMPVMDGVAVATALFGPDWTFAVPRVIVLTTFALDAAAATAIRAGASGFLLKGASRDLLYAAIRTVAGGTAVLAPNDLQQLLAAVEPEQPLPAEPPAAYRTLTGRERTVFARAARGLSNAEIASAEFLSESTVRTHVSNVLSKLALRDRAQLIVYAHDHHLLPARS